MAVRGILFLLTGLLLGGCMQATTSDRPSPVSDANFTARDRQQLANPPYEQASIPYAYQRQIVQFHRKEAPGSIVVDTDARFLYYVLPEEKAIRYGVIVGEDAQAWSGVAKVGRKQEWPSWTPTEGEKRRLGPLPNYVEGGAHNPMGARGIYLYSDDKDTLYRIHGTNQPQWIGHAISSGCIRLTNEDVIDLYSRVKMGAIVVVLGPNQSSRMLHPPVAATQTRYNLERVSRGTDDESHGKRVRDGPAQDGAHESSLSSTTAKLMVFKLVLHHLYRLCAEALGDLARRVDAGLSGEIDGLRPIDFHHVAIGGWGRHRIEDLAAPERHKSVAERRREKQVRPTPLAAGSRSPRS